MGAGSEAGAGGGRRPSLARLPHSPARWTPGPQGPWAVEGAGGGTWAPDGLESAHGHRQASGSPGPFRRHGGQCDWSRGLQGPARQQGEPSPRYTGEGTGCERLQEAWGHLAAELGPEPRPAGGSALRSAHARPGTPGRRGWACPPTAPEPGRVPAGRASPSLASWAAAPSPPVTQLSCSSASRLLPFFSFFPKG